MRICLILYKCNIFAFSGEPRVPNKIATWQPSNRPLLAIFYLTTIKNNKKGKANYAKPMHMAGRKKKGASNVTKL